MTAVRDAVEGSDGVPRRVLVVDDEYDLAHLAKALLESHGFDVQVACSAEEALHVLESDAAIDALFSDIMMPGMTGLQLAREVGQRHPHIRIVLTSGYTLPSLLAEQDVPHPFVGKPYQIDAVVRLLRAGRATLGQDKLVNAIQVRP